jgi:hypothetical protein
MCNPRAAARAQTNYANVAEHLLRGKQKSLTFAERASGSGAAATTCARKKSLKEFRGQKPTKSTQSHGRFCAIGTIAITGKVSCSLRSKFVSIAMCRAAC